MNFEVITQDVEAAEAVGGVGGSEPRRRRLKEVFKRVFKPMGKCHVKVGA
jgi:hypothetical protein